ncbi:MAG: preprotein translocase subunit SecG [Clostridia bacterium]|nr:preprotein translocase subunit SecG [Clostridia bacterium]
MDIFEIVVNFLLLIAAVILVIVVLAQDSKSSGLGSAFGSETTAINSRSKKASRERQLQKLTVIFAIIVAVLAVLMLLMPAFEKWFTPKSTSAMLSAIRNIF